MIMTATTSRSLKAASCSPLCVHFRRTEASTEPDPPLGCFVEQILHPRSNWAQEGPSSAGSPWHPRRAFHRPSAGPHLPHLGVRVWFRSQVPDALEGPPGRRAPAQSRAWIDQSTLDPRAFRKASKSERSALRASEVSEGEDPVTLPPSPSASSPLQLPRPPREPWGRNARSSQGSRQNPPG